MEYIKKFDKTEPWATQWPIKYEKKCSAFTKGTHIVNCFLVHSAICQRWKHKTKIEHKRRTCFDMLLCLNHQLWRRMQRTMCHLCTACKYTITIADGNTFHLALTHIKGAKTKNQKAKVFWHLALARRPVLSALDDLFHTRTNSFCQQRKLYLGDT